MAKDSIPSTCSKTKMYVVTIDVGDEVQTQKETPVIGVITQEGLTLNDWTDTLEKVEEHLLNGGTVLLIGGEEGANGR